MDTYLYQAIYNKTGRNGGRVVNVSVWKIQDNTAVYIGTTKANSAAWKGESSTAAALIAEHDDLPMSDGYRLDDKSINLVDLGSIQK